MGHSTDHPRDKPNVGDTCMAVALQHIDVVAETGGRCAALVKGFRVSDAGAGVEIQVIPETGKYAPILSGGELRAVARDMQ